MPVYRCQAGISVDSSKWAISATVLRADARRPASLSGSSPSSVPPAPTGSEPSDFRPEQGMMTRVSSVPEPRHIEPVDTEKAITFDAAVSTAERGACAWLGDRSVG